MFRELSSTGDIGVLANCKGLTKAVFSKCPKITGKKCRGKFFGNQSSKKFAGSFLPGDIKVFEHAKDLKWVNMRECEKITGKRSFFEPSLETSPL